MVRKEPPLNPIPFSALLWAYLRMTGAADAVAPLILRRRLRQGKEDAARLNERLGHPGASRPDGPLVWFHAASVGESLSLLALMAQIAAARPDAALLVTTGTRTSAEMLASRLPGRALHQFAPLDTARAVARFLDHWRPDVAVWTESELWPRMIVETSARAVPMVLINARISPKSAARWRRAPRMIGALLARFQTILAQDDDTAEILQGLGVPPARLLVTGSLKQEVAALPCDEAELGRLRRAIGARPVWLAASTHPGEEEAAAAAHARLLADRPDLLLILAPRHPDRAASAEAALAARGFSLARRSAGGLPGAADQAYLADTLGEMGLWYRLAPVAFVGGSLAPVGGHNPYEPAMLGAAIVSGPHVRNFAQTFAELDRLNGVSLVADANGLAGAVAALMEPGRAARQAANARRIFAAQPGATACARDAILARLPQPVPPR